mgnify:CR=1 FL=1
MVRAHVGAQRKVFISKAFFYFIRFSFFFLGEKFMLSEAEVAYTSAQGKGLIADPFFISAIFYFSSIAVNA